MQTVGERLCTCLYTCITAGFWDIKQHLDSQDMSGLQRLEKLEDAKVDTENLKKRESRCQSTAILENLGYCKLLCVLQCLN